MGILLVKGTIDLGQFWPTGTADADTTTIKVEVNKESFRFKASSSSAAAATSVFWDARVRGNGTKPAVRGGKISIRLQGIDAPELHYRPSPLGKKGTEKQKAALKEVNKEYRQYLGETAAHALGEMLRKHGEGAASIGCTVTTMVDRPTDVFDTYGRFVGDIEVVSSGGKRVNVNQWLVKNGWAFPTFYTSMTSDEIEAYIDAWKMGSKVKGRLGTYYSRKLATFKQSLQYRRHGDLNPAKDLGAVNMPKIFRRQTTWWTYKKAGVISEGFVPYLAQGKDEFMLTKDFIEHGIHAASTQKFGDCFKGNSCTLDPEDFVFKESPSKLISPEGKEILSW